jgi:hypothetical protein
MKSELVADDEKKRMSYDGRIGTNNQTTTKNIIKTRQTTTQKSFAERISI